MKKVLVFGIILILLIFLIPLKFSKVEAYTGEIDPENYITMPGQMNIVNGEAVNTISLSAEASDYTISYQKIDIAKEQMDNIFAKVEEVEKYITDNGKLLEEKEKNVQELYDTYTSAVEAGGWDVDQLEELRKQYEVAKAEYEEFYSEISENLTGLQDELRLLIPDYTDSWIETTNSSDNVELDFSQYSGEVYFVLWAKIENETETYYDVELYSTLVQNEETITISESSVSIEVGETIQLTAISSNNASIKWTSSDASIARVSSDGLVIGEKEGTAIITATGDEKTATCEVVVTEKQTENDGGTLNPNDTIDLDGLLDSNKGQMSTNVITPEDDTTAPGSLPQTGVGIFIGIIILVIICIATISYIQYRKNNF